MDSLALREDRAGNFLLRRSATKAEAIRAVKKGRVSYRGIRFDNSSFATADQRQLICYSTYAKSLLTARMRQRMCYIIISYNELYLRKESELVSFDSSWYNKKEGVYYGKVRR